MPILECILLGENGLFEKKGGKPSIINIFDKLSGNKFPLMQPRMSVYVKTKGTPGEKFNLNLKIQHENDEKPLFDHPTEIVADSLKGIAHYMADLKALIFEKPGIYTFTVYVDNKRDSAISTDLDVIDTSDHV